MTEPDATTLPESEWVIRIYLGSEDDDAAQKWMDVIDGAVMSHDPGFSGFISMRKERITAPKQQECPLCGATKE